MRASILTAIVAFTLALAACGSAGAQSTTDPSVVQTDAGAVQGTVTDDTRIFQGIPFAKPPTGDDRWQPPAAVEPWDGERDATAPSPACAQPQDQPIAIENYDEDCLYLNVATPADTTDERLPVIVVIHGGSFTYSDGASHDAQRMASEGNAIVVTPNYRLGAFGFLAHPDMDDTNLGLADQQAALEWVQQNAAAFGGDTDNVTAMGQSGGGYSVCSQLAMPEADDLIDKAILQSTDCLSPSGSHTLEDAESAGHQLTETLDCDDLDCLRDKDTDDILTSAEAGHEAFRPVHGADDLPKAPKEALSGGAFNHVPLMIGSVSDEAVGPIAGEEIATSDALTADEYEQHITELFDDHAAEVLDEYPVDSYDTPSNALSAVNTDSMWSTPIHHMRETLAEYVPVHAYEVNEEDSPWFVGAGEPSFTLGTDHMADLEYLLDMEIFEERSDSQEHLAEEMVRFWTDFAHTGQPGNDWQEFDADGYVQGLSTDHIGPIDFVADRNVTFWS